MNEQRLDAPCTLCVVTAMPLEARPIIDGWMLRRVHGSTLAMYEGELPGPRVPVLLVVSGVGRVAAAAGVAWLAAQVARRVSGRSAGQGGTRPSAAQRTSLRGVERLAEQRTAWINYGIGGASRLHAASPWDGASLPNGACIGQTVLAAKVVDEERRRSIEREAEEKNSVGTVATPSGGNAVLARSLHRVPAWFPPWLAGRAREGSGLALTARCTVRTVDRPESEYGLPGVYEMEAAGFVETALRFSTAELVQVLKVVSDSPKKGVAELDRSTVRTCSEQGLPALAALAQVLVETASALPGLSLRGLDSGCFEGLRLSVTEGHQWQRLVERVVALRGEEAVGLVIEKALQGAPRRPVLALEAIVDELAVEELL